MTAGLNCLKVILVEKKTGKWLAKRLFLLKLMGN